MPQISLSELTDICAELAGLGHDLGKNTNLFQRKLEDPDFPSSDPVRHEWVSLLLLDQLASGMSLAEAHDQVATMSWDALGTLPFDKRQPLNGPLDAVRFAVATHHGLFAPLNSSDYELGSGTNGRSHVRKKVLAGEKTHPFFADPGGYLARKGEIDADIELGLQALLCELHSTTQAPSAALLRKLSLYMRACLIIADHTVSRRPVRNSNAQVYANTMRSSDPDIRTLNQSLSYHLQEVAGLARKIGAGLREYVWPGVSDESLNRICEPAPQDSPFAWQNQAFEALKKVRAGSRAPALVLDVAETGAGKTRMNIKAAAALNQRPALRLTTALNLRVLTLQTGAAFRRELGLDQKELACVIGDPVIRQLFNAGANVDENPVEPEFSASKADLVAPEFLAEYFQVNPDDARLAGVPLLVSTIDFVIAAGEPQKQGHHALALIRAMNADLVIDEIDDYDPAAFVAVLRLVEAAARHGANVIASSATLPRPMVKELTRVFVHGSAIFNEEHQIGEDPIIAFIGNLAEADIQRSSEPEILAQAYSGYMDKALERVKSVRTKLGIIVPVPELSEAGFCEAVLNSTIKLDKAHRWSYGRSGKTLSVGLVRVANIRQAIPLARYLSLSLPDDYIACYHSNDFLIQRQRKEQILDSLLSRKNGNAALVESSYVQALLEASKAKHIKLIVVATPVEEVGRDHDFDWAVIEPSSTRSIVQTAGRVNRHRRIRVDEPNVHIMQFNALHCRSGGERGRAVFIRPGNEPTGPGKSWASHDLEDLLNWSSEKQIDAQLRLGDHEMARLENEAIEHAISRPSRILSGENSKRQLDWLNAWFYRKHPLRDRDHSMVWTLQHGKFYVWQLGPSVADWRERSDLVSEIPPVSNGWLCWSPDELAEYARDKGINMHKAFEFSVSSICEPLRKLEVDWSFGIKLATK
jgi:CRISPR-associated endonuclease/helicase Cas3